MNIDAARKGDLPEVLALLGASKLPVVGIDQHVPSMIVARETTTIVGCAAVEVYGETGLLRSVAVAPQWRGTGLGQRLTRAALELARARSVRTVYLLTTTAEGFFPRFGFVPISRAELDPALQQSAELRGACPATAVAMRLDLSTSSRPSPQSSSPLPAPRR